MSFICDGSSALGRRNQSINQSPLDAAAFASCAERSTSLTCLLARRAEVLEGTRAERPVVRVALSEKRRCEAVVRAQDLRVRAHARGHAERSVAVGPPGARWPFACAPLPIEITPFSCECNPLRITVRDGAQRELVTNERSKSAPSAASASMCGVRTTGARWLRYAEMPALARSSACMKSKFGASLRGHCAISSPSPSPLNGETLVQQRIP